MTVCVRILVSVSFALRCQIRPNNTLSQNAASQSGHLGTGTRDESMDMSDISDISISSNDVQLCP